MHTEPSKAEPPKRKRRWFQFRLRTLMIGVTLLAAVCGYVAREVAIAKERREAAETYEPLREVFVLKSRSGIDEYESRYKLNQAPWPLGWLGEDGYAGIVVPDNTPADEMSRLKRLFPESAIIRKSDAD